MANETAVRNLVAAGLVAVALVWCTPAGAATVLGQVATGDLTIDGAAAPAGTTLLSPTLVATGARAGLVYLDNGQVLALGPGTRTYLEEAPEGEVRASVQSGSLLVRQSSGTLMTVAQNDVVQLDQEGAEIGEGKKVGGAEEMVELCRLVDWTAQLASLCSEDPSLYECDWELIEVAPGEVEAHLAEGDVYPGNDNNEYGLDEDCNDEAAAAAAAPGWLANVSNSELIVASVLGAVTIGYWIDQDDEDRAASLVQP